MPKYKHRSADQWKNLIDDQRNSGLSAPRYCQKHDLGYASFCQWRKKLCATATSPTEQLPAFVEVEAQVGLSANPHWVVELQLGSDTVLRIGKL